jgi:hypothetical protein
MFNFIIRVVSITIALVLSNIALFYVLTNKQVMKWIMKRYINNAVVAVNNLDEDIQNED